MAIEAHDKIQPVANHFDGNHAQAEVTAERSMGNSTKMASHEAGIPSSIPSAKINLDHRTGSGTIEFGTNSSSSGEKVADKYGCWTNYGQTSCGYSDRDG